MGKHCILILILLQNLLSVAQEVEIKVVDAHTNISIQGATLQIKDLKSKIIHTFITSSDGKTSYDGKEYPIIIKTSHVSYITGIDTLQSNTPHTIYISQKNKQLNPVVITGQYHPQSATHSVYNVKVISKKEIEQQAALQLPDILRTQLNIRLSSDLAIGSTGISLQGLSGNNLKVLIDGVPIVGRNGNGNNADLGQINLANIESIEIVEGPMAINFGANALAGVINLITKKNLENKLDINLQLHEETAGSEYGIQRGKHYQNLSTSYKISDKWETQINLGRNDFRGYQGDLEGRTFEWNPKRQYFSTANLHYKHKKMSVGYTFDYLNEKISDFGISKDNIQPATGVNRPFAFDETYQSYRYSNKLQLSNNINEHGNYSIVFSNSDYKRAKNRFSKDLTTGTETPTTKEGDQDTSTYNAWVMRGTYRFTPQNKSINLEIGYDINLEKAGGGRISSGEKKINDFGFYSSAEIKLLPSLKVRPGIRASVNSVYSSPIVPSLNVKYDITPKTQLRFAYGRGFRAPTVRELHFEFVDTNHKIFGNDNLVPEYAHHLDFGISKQYRLGKKSILKQKATVFYNTIDNQITFAQSKNDATITTFINALKFKSQGVSINNQLASGDLWVDLGFSYIGRYNRISEVDSLDLDTYFYSPEVNGNINYSLPKLKTTFSLFYKYTGKLQNYIQDGTAIKKGTIEGYSWLDFTLQKTITKNINLTLGARNIFDITRINSTTSGAHSGGRSQPVSYGRSYFLKLNFNFKHK